MTQELIDLKTSILEGRYKDALAIVDELDWMSRKGTIRQIKSFLARILVHLIKNQVEQRLTNSWAISISDSVRQIQDLNLQDNKTSYYIKRDEWLSILEEEFEAAIDVSSAEIFSGSYSPFQLIEIVDKSQITAIAERLIALTYETPAKNLLARVKQNLEQLPGGADWKFGRR